MKRLILFAIQVLVLAPVAVVALALYWFGAFGGAGLGPLPTRVADAPNAPPPATGVARPRPGPVTRKAGPPPATAPKVTPRAAAPSPLVTDPTRLAAARAAREARYLRQTAKVYEATAPADAAGRAEGLAALTLAARHLAQPGRPDWTLVPAEAQLRKAVAAGCADPLVRYYHARFADWAGRPQADDWVAIGDGMGKAPYPPVVKMNVFFNAAHHLLAPGPVPPARRAAAAARLRDAFWAAFKETAADPAGGPDVLEIFGVMVAHQTLFGDPREAVAERTFDLLKEAGAREPVRLAAEGLYRLEQPWGAKGMYPLGSLPRDQGQAARKEVTAAHEALEKAWAGGLEESAVATGMITACTVLGRPREEMETWFARAVAAEPDGAEACRRKMLALSPTWGGAVEDMLGFARQCRATANWEADIPQVALAGIGRIREKYQPQILTKPEVWAEAEAVYEGWLAAHPDSRRARTLYAQSALAAGRFDTAVAQFDALRPGGPWPPAAPFAAAFARDEYVARAMAAGGKPGARFQSDGYQWNPDYARRTTARKVREEWYTKAARPAYEKLHPAAAPGRAEGLAAVAAIAHAHGIDATPNSRQDAAWAAADKAVTAGCTDPLVRYHHLRLGAATGLADPDPAGKLAKAAAAFAASKYPPALRLAAALDAAALDAGDATGRARARKMDDFWEVFQAAAADPDPHAQRDVLALAVSLMESAEFTGGTRQGTHARVSKALADAKADPYQQLVLDGVERTSAAWDVRGGGLSNTVSRAQWDSFFATLRDARANLEAAWRIHPDRPEAPTHMLAVCMGSQAARGEMEEWFARAVAANPDNADAVRRRALFLEPKWFGSKNGTDYIDAQSAVINVHNWEAGFGAVALELQTTLRGYRRKPADDPQEWEAVESLFQNFWLKKEPNSRHAKTLFARAALEARQAKVAARLLGELDGKPWPGVFPGGEVYDRLVEAVRKEAGVAVD